jgi:hypothetical protein
LQDFVQTCARECAGALLGNENVARLLIEFQSQVRKVWRALDKGPHKIGPSLRSAGNVDKHHG